MQEIFGWCVLYIVVMALYLCEVTTQWFFFTTCFFFFFFSESVQCWGR